MFKYNFISWAYFIIITKNYKYLPYFALTSYHLQLLDFTKLFIKFNIYLISREDIQNTIYYQYALSFINQIHWIISNSYSSNYFPLFFFFSSQLSLSFFAFSIVQQIKFFFKLDFLDHLITIKYELIYIPYLFICFNSFAC